MLTIEFVLDEDHYRDGVDRTMRDGVRPAMADLQTVDAPPPPSACPAPC